jgi:hypothetical protein
MSGRHTPENETDPPVTLHAVIQTAIASGLNERYQLSQDVPHELLVLLMQINEQRRPRKSASQPRR